MVSIKRKIAEKQRQLRDRLWPDIEDSHLWKKEKTSGWTNVPRTMPVILRIMDNLSKGRPVSSVYLELWFRTFDDSFVVANKHVEMAFFSNFNGERAVRTWKTRIDILASLGFIEVAEGPSGDISYILILNPHNVIKELYEKGEIRDQEYNAFYQRMIDIGAKDLED